MPEFNWVALNKSGRKAKGSIEAASEKDVMALVKARGLNPVKVTKAPKPIIIPGLDGVDLRTLMVFTRTFATMIDAGLPLVQCLEILAQQQTHPVFKQSLKDIKANVESGGTFADSLSKFPKIFDELFVNLVAAGETGGILDNILNRLGEYMEKSAKLKKEVKGAMIYPVVTVVVAVVVVLVLMLFVIPVFETMFSDMGGELPGLTQMVIDMSRAFTGNLGIVVGVTFGVPFGLAMFKKTKVGSRAFDWTLLHAPLFSDLILKSNVARFTRTMGTMLQAGVPIMDGLEICAKTAGNIFILEEIMMAREGIGEGQQLAEPLVGSTVFPPLMVQMIEVGEQTGALDEMMVKLADFYDEEVESAVAALTSAIEPLMMVALGGILGTLVVAMYLPIFTLADQVH